MNAVAKDRIEQIRTIVTALSKEGKYGEAVCYLNSILLSSDEELKRAIKDAIREKENEDYAIEGCCNCCSACNCQGIGGLFCIGFMVTFCCCGEDVATSLCGCDWLLDSSSSCVRDQCC